MRLGTKLFLLALAGGSWATILTGLLAASLYFWPIPTAREMCGDALCAEREENSAFEAYDLELTLPGYRSGYRSSSTTFSMSLWELEERSKLPVFQALTNFADSRLGPHAAIVAGYVAVHNLVNPETYPTPHLSYPTAGGEATIAMVGPLDVYLILHREIVVIIPTVTADHFDSVISNQAAN
ncbi:MAG: hypothetical protein WD940_01840 [Patescibacteria group bacterium]